MENLNPKDYEMNKPQFYVRTYKGLFSHLRDKPVKMLELGIDKGGSLHFWRDYFQQGTIAGLDIESIDVEDASGRIHTFVGPQQDSSLLAMMA